MRDHADRNAGSDRAKVRRLPPIVLVCASILALGACADPRPPPELADLPVLVAEPAAVVAEPWEPIEITVTNEGDLPIELLQLHAIHGRHQLVEVAHEDLPLVLQGGDSTRLTVQGDNGPATIGFSGIAPDLYLPAADGPLPRVVQVPVVIAAASREDESILIHVAHSHAAQVEGEPGRVQAAILAPPSTECGGPGESDRVRVDASGATTLSWRFNAPPVPDNVPSASYRVYISCDPPDGDRTEHAFDTAGWWRRTGLRWAD